MNTTLTLMPIVALFLALSWHTRPTLAAVVATAVYIMLLIAIARMARRHRKQHRRVSPRLLAYLFLTAVTIAYPFCNRDCIKMLLQSDESLRATARVTQLYARPTADSTSPLPTDNDCGTWEAFDLTLDEDFDSQLNDPESSHR